jgi:exopolysaccharide biosynthesis polyprenyl glycosylphosphotransferase
MNELFRKTVNTAERAIVGEDITVQDYLELLLNDPKELQSGDDEDRAYLAVLLDSMGLRDESIQVLQDAPDSGQNRTNAALRNVEGMLAAAHGEYERARNMLRRALAGARDHPSLRIKILANLAAVSLRAESIKEAEAWADAADSGGEPTDPGVAVLIASVRASIASRREDLSNLRIAAASLGKASKSRLAELGSQHPRAFATVANMASTEIMVAQAEKSLVHLERAISVLEVAAFRLAAEFGADHPQTLAAMANLASAELDLALAEGSSQNIEQANAALAKIHWRIASAAHKSDTNAAAPDVPTKPQRTGFLRPVRILARGAAASVGSDDTANPRLGGGGRHSASMSATMALERPGWYLSSSHQSYGGRPFWTRSYLRKLAIVDVGAAIAAVTAALQLSFGGNFTRTYLALSLAFPLFWIAALSLAGAYDVRFIGTGPDEFRKVLGAGIGLTTVGVTLSYAANIGFSRVYLFTALPTVVVLDLIGRYALRKRLHKLRALGRCMSTVVAVGPELPVADLITELRRDKHHGLSVVAACVAGAGSEEVAGVPVIGGLGDVGSAVRRCRADTVAVLPCPEIDGVKLRSLAWELEKTGTDLYVAPALLDVAGPRTTVRPTAGLTLLHVDHPRLSGPQQVMKGVFDRCAAGVALVVLAPLMLALAIAIRLSDGGPAVFTQTRVGKDGRVFKIYKFRTMVVDAERLRAQLVASNDLDGVLFKIRRDPRITKMGAGLRRWRIDKLPQLLNVFLGDMSLVGPRPALPDEAAKYADHVRRRLVVKPGLTGLWQVSGRSDLSWDESVRLDLRYVENWSFALDLQILWKTISVVLRGSGAY